MELREVKIGLMGFSETISLDLGNMKKFLRSILYIELKEDLLNELFLGLNSAITEELDEFM